MQQVVRLLGDLGERYGAEHTYHNLRTPADAIKLLCINSPELQKELVYAHEHGVGYRLIQAGIDLDYADLRLPFGSNDLILTPVIAGSGGSTSQILIGVGLVAASFLLPGAGLFGTTGLITGATTGTFSGLAAVSGLAGTLTTVGTALSAVGASLILGGVSQMLSPQPTIDNPRGPQIRGSGESGATDGPQSVVRGSNGRQSYMYTGATNTVGVGATIPVVYGEVLAGSHLLSARVEVADESDPLKASIRNPGPSTVLVGGETINGLTYAQGFRYRIWDENGVRGGIQSSTTKTLTPGEGNSVSLQDVDYASGESRRNNYMVFFELNDGLFEFVSGPGTTLVDGFITFEVSLSASVSGPDIEVARVRTTVQGLLKKGQVYRFMQYIKYPEVDDADGINTKVRIIDAGCDSSCNLTIRNNGYRLFRIGDYWNAPINT
tara:strand:+ start:1851 stop:3158 length:1308 start_codon:yes stop_codon:yes gene_type:complete